MFTTAKKFEEILTCLSILKYIIKSKSKKGLFDTNKHAESFFCKILNTTYKWKLDNMNHVSLNYPAIDLGDSHNRICAQITSDNTSLKIKNTIDTFIEHNLHKQYDRLIIFTLADIKKYKANFDTQGKFSFDKDKDIIDTDKLLSEIEKLEDRDITVIHDFVKSELKPLKAIFVEKGSLLSDVEKTTIEFPSNINKFLTHQNYDKEDYIIEYDGVHHLYTKIVNLPKKTRECLFALLYKSQENKSFSYTSRLYTLCYEVTTYINKPEHILKRQFDILISHELISYENEGNVPRFELYSASPNKNNYFSQIKDFANSDPDLLKEIIIECNFHSLSD